MPDCDMWYAFSIFAMHLFEFQHQLSQASMSLLCSHSLQGVVHEVPNSFLDVMLPPTVLLNWTATVENYEMVPALLLLFSSISF
jgi:hypothetical protein